MKKLLLVLSFFVAVQGAVNAQGNELMFNWQIGIPGPELNQLIDKTSFQGWAFEYRYAFNNRFTVGGNFNWTIFHQEIDKSTWNFDNVDITSRNWRYTHVVPLSVTFHFNPLSNHGAKTQLFMGGGLGGNYLNQEVWAGMYTFRHENWGFHAYPELGFRHVMSDQTAWFVSGQFMWLPGASYTGEDLTYWSIRVGLSFGTHRWKE